MDAAYDHITSFTLESSADPSTTSEHTLEKPSSPNAEPGNLSTDLQDAYKSFSNSPWGAKLGGFFGSVRKQGETFYQGARDEASIAGEEALKGFADLRSTIVNRTRTLSLGEAGPSSSATTTVATAPSTAPGERTAENSKEADETATAMTESAHESTAQEKDGPVAAAAAAASSALPTSLSSSSQDTISPNDTEGFISRFRSEAEKRLKDIQRAEDAADEALLKFGTNIRNFLRDAVTVTAPSSDDLAAAAEAAAASNNNNTSSSSSNNNNDASSAASKILFESKDAEGKRVIHTTRFDAQLHVIHCSLDSFLKDPASTEYAKWKEGFDVEAKTGEIAQDLQKYEEIRRAMERCVPERVEYNVFWARYYFLRMVIESEERRRKEMLKGATLNPEQEVAWDEDSDDEEPSTPQPKPRAADSSAAANPESKTGEKPEPLSSSVATLEPLEPRKSQDQHSQSGSDASYDLVSGATSKTPSSPREENGAKKAGASEATVKEESDEEDWE